MVIKVKAGDVDSLVNLSIRMEEVRNQRGDRKYQNLKADDLLIDTLQVLSRITGIEEVQSIIESYKRIPKMYC